MAVVQGPLPVISSSSAAVCLKGISVRQTATKGEQVEWCTEAQVPRGSSVFCITKIYRFSLLLLPPVPSCLPRSGIASTSTQLSCWLYVCTGCLIIPLGRCVIYEFTPFLRESQHILLTNTALQVPFRSMPYECVNFLKQMVSRMLGCPWCIFMRHVNIFIDSTCAKPFQSTISTCAAEQHCGNRAHCYPSQAFALRVQ